MEVIKIDCLIAMYCLLNFFNNFNIFFFWTKFDTGKNKMYRHGILPKWSIYNKPSAELLLSTVVSPFFFNDFLDFILQEDTTDLLFLFSKCCKIYPSGTCPRSLPCPKHLMVPVFSIPTSRHGTCPKSLLWLTHLIMPKPSIPTSQNGTCPRSQI